MLQTKSMLYIHCMLSDLTISYIYNILLKSENNLRNFIYINNNIIIIKILFIHIYKEF